MTLYEWVLTALLAVPVSKHDRDVAPEVKREQIEYVAHGIVSATQATITARKWPGSERELAGLLITVARFESGLALYVHSGNCPRPTKPTECDSGRARGIWQQQVSSTSSHEAWLALAGLNADSTRFAAHEAARALTRARWMCRSLEHRGVNWVEMVFSAYAGRGCVGWFRGRNERVSSFRRLVL